MSKEHLHDHSHEQEHCHCEAEHNHEHKHVHEHKHNHGTEEHTHEHSHVHSHTHEHSGDHNHTHSNCCGHEHSNECGAAAIDNLTKEEKTLKVLLHHWVDHNKSHEESFKEWVEKAKVMNRTETSDYIVKAIEYMEKADEMLLEAQKHI